MSPEPSQRMIGQPQNTGSQQVSTGYSAIRPIVVMDSKPDSVSANIIGGEIAVGAALFDWSAE